jgi:LmbE family N-acetylglucosaminyl deacetylase
MAAKRGNVLSASNMRRESLPATRRLMILGAHPDDCEWMGGGLAALCIRAGWTVRFVSATNGDAGHHEMAPRALAARRRIEARRAAAVIGAKADTLGEHDGRLFVNDRTTEKAVSAIRRFDPDILIAHRVTEYHRDHRYAAQLVLDASFVLQVPLVYPKVPAPRRVPVIFYACDFFTEGTPFRADFIVDVTDVLETRTHMLLEHVSQFQEWIPWLNGNRSAGRRSPATDLEDISRGLEHRPRAIALRYAAMLKRKYRRKVGAAEAFMLSEYGRRASASDLAKLLPW